MFLSELDMFRVNKQQQEILLVLAAAAEVLDQEGPAVTVGLAEMGQRFGSLPMRPEHSFLITILFLAKAEMEEEEDPPELPVMPEDLVMPEARDRTEILGARDRTDQVQLLEILDRLHLIHGLVQLETPEILEPM